MDAPKTGEFAHIGKSVFVKGELSGSEDLYVDGHVEGSIELRNNSLIVGPNGSIKATVSAKSVVIQGKVDALIALRASRTAEVGGCKWRCLLALDRD
jgi:cytoskeletal protein CcmA (bactofilin family)